MKWANPIQTQICIFEVQIYSFILQLSVQTAQKRPKNLKIKPFVPFRAKSWFRINGRDTQFDCSCYVSRDKKASPHFDDLLFSAFFRIWRACQPRRWNPKYFASVIKEKASARALKINASFWHTFFLFPLCPKFNLQRVPWKKSQNMVK